MGMVRKIASISTLGMIKYTSRREAQTKAALAQARLADAEAARHRAAARQEARQPQQDQR